MGHSIGPIVSHGETRYPTEVSFYMRYSYSYNFGVILGAARPPSFVLPAPHACHVSRAFFPVAGQACSSGSPSFTRWPKQAYTHSWWHPAPHPSQPYPLSSGGYRAPLTSFPLPPPTPSTPPLARARWVGAAAPRLTQELNDIIGRKALPTPPADLCDQANGQANGQAIGRANEANGPTAASAAAAAATSTSAVSASLPRVPGSGSGVRHGVSLGSWSTASAAAAAQVGAGGGGGFGDFQVEGLDRPHFFEPR